MCTRCRRDKKVPKVWSGENNMDPMAVPKILSDMSDAEQMLIARLAPTVHVHLLKHGGIASKGHCIAFPQAVQEPATILPRLPAEVDIIRVRRQGKDDTHKDFRVRRHRVEGALRWLKDNNPAYGDVVIDGARIQNLPEDGELPNLRTVEFSETERVDDQGPAPQQLNAGETDCTDDSTVSGVILPEPGVNVQAQVEAAVNEVVSEPTSEFTTPYFFTMAFPCLFPYGKGDFHINRPVTYPSLHDWAEHLLWYQDGRFARHKVWKFFVHNMIMRKRALKQSRFFVDQQLGDPHITVADLQERLARGDTFTDKFLYFGANLRGIAQYWQQRRRELRALVEFMVNEKRGLPSFFMTGSCAEFYFPPLRRLLEEYILQTKGEEVNLAEDSNARFKAVQENTHVVVSYFDLRTQAYHEKSRGQIHWHQLSWREDRQPHQLLHEACEDGCEYEEYAARLSQWAYETFAMTALHLAGNDEEGQPRKDLWPPPEGTAEPISDDRDPLVKVLMQIAATQDAILEDNLLLVNRVGLHSCSDYCLRTPRHPEQGLQPRERVCRMEFGSEYRPGKKIHSNPEIVEDHNGAPHLEMPRDHPRVVQHSRYQLQSWRANGDVSLILSNSPPDNPSTDDIIAIIGYVCGYACKDSEPTGATSDLFKDMVNAVDAGDADQVTGKSMCAKMLIKTVGRRDISGPEASFELIGLALWRCSLPFTYLSMSGSRRLERDGETATRSTPLDKYLARSQDEHCSCTDRWKALACNELTVPTGPLLEKMQKKCENLKVLVGDERSMFGRMGWMEQHARYAINKGANADQLWGGIPVAVFMGDDVQLPPVCDTPVYISDCRSAPSNHGHLVWTMFDSAVELTQIIRQNESEQQLRDVLMSLRNYTTTPQQIHWLQQFQWHNLRTSHGPELLARMDEQGLYVFPTHRLEWQRNKTKLLECNRQPNHPVAKIKAVHNGRHAVKADSNKAG
ncbi:unnamed protein product [Porites lobata]|uniref:DNA helicase n=1 Tax=Porites lobata TaxID=104759 RepID=A0ABN8PD68_9CNID|nr:unnamed protein product [Porites lobata]